MWASSVVAQRPVNKPLNQGKGSGAPHSPHVYGLMAVLVFTDNLPHSAGFSHRFEISSTASENVQVRIPLHVLPLFLRLSFLGALLGTFLLNLIILCISLNFFMFRLKIAVSSTPFSSRKATNSR